MSRDDAVLFALREGNKLDTTTAELLELRLRSDPSDVDARLKLLGFLCQRHLTSPELARRRTAHIVWFVENEPQHDIIGTPLTMMSDSGELGLADAKAAWAIHLAIATPDPNVVLHAARFFAHISPIESQKLLERGEQLKPDWPVWAHELGTSTFRHVVVALHVACSGREPVRPTLDVIACRREAAVALVHFERALTRCESEESRFPYLSDAAEAALEADENEKARKFAEEILRLEPQQATHPHRLDYIHTAHIALGRVALVQGEIPRAIDELLAAGNIGSANAPVLRSFGPDFLLANRLYARGEKAAVLAYLDECARFWNAKRIAVWRGQIERGEHARLFRGYDPDLP